jgi:hypothetical protein
MARMGGPPHRRRCWELPPLARLCAVHGSRGAAARGFVHYDWKWRNDTDDLVGDLARVAGVAPAVQRDGQTADEVRVTVALPGGRLERDHAEAAAGAIEGLLERLNF